MKKSQLLLTLSLFGLLASCSNPPASSASSKDEESSSEATSSATQTSSASSEKTSGAATTEQSATLPEIDYVKVFAPSVYTHIWAWTRDGGVDTNYFDVGWPGQKMSKYDNDWNTYDFKDRKDIYVIVSEGGTNQSQDFQITSPGYWWYYEGTWAQENPMDHLSSSSSAEETSIDTSFEPIDDKLDNRHRTWYQLLVYSFADSNNDGIGDFKGIANHLDYLQKLGIGGLWLSPIHPADSYHGYDVKDYKAVNSVYEVGGYKFENLLADCHKRGIKIILDMVFNHTSNNHAWRGNNGWYSGEYIFGGGMPDLNYDNSQVREAVKDVGKYWLNKGVDGFRCDAAAWIYGGGGNWTPEEVTFQKSVQWWKEFSNAMKAVKSDVYLVGEVYTDLNWVEKFYASGMNAFNFSASYWPRNAFNDNDSAKWVEEVAGHQQRVRQQDNNAVEASFLSNHDTGRYASIIKNKEQLIFSNALNVLSPGGSFIYYGDELGMTGSSDGWEDMSYRTPMPFASGKTNGNKYMGKNANTNTMSGKTADADTKDANSIFSKTAKAINYKNENPALYSGKATKVDTSNQKLGALKVEGSSSTYYLLVNATGDSVEAKITGEYTLDFALPGKDDDKINDNKGTINLPARSVAVIKGGNSLGIRG